MSNHTLSIFRMLLANLPPLFPAETAEKMKNALEQLENDPRATLQMAEDTMIKFGYDLWPWNEAYRDFFGINDGRLGEQFFLSHLPGGHADHFMKYKEYGLSWHDLYSGRAVKYFDTEDRPELNEALVETKNDLFKYTNREVTGLERKKYLARVEEFKKILEKTKQILAQMRAMADAEQYHPALADEIRSRTRYFEMSLCSLGPSFNVDEVLRSLEFFVDRKTHLNLMRGIDKPAQIDIYN